MDTSPLHTAYSHPLLPNVRVAGLHAYQQPIAAMLKRLADERLVERLWAYDASLWHPAAETQAKIRSRLGWLDLPSSDLSDLHAWLQTMRSRHATDVLYVGTGDASTIAWLWLGLANHAATDFKLTLLDTIEPACVRTTLDGVPWERTAVVVAAGTDWTPDDDALVRLVIAARLQAADANDLPLTVIAPPQSSLIQKIRSHAQPMLLPLPTDLGGRFGALSALGLAPAALVGWDLERLCVAAKEMVAACGHSDDLAANPGVWLGTMLAVLAQQGRDKLTLLAPPELQPLASWITAFVSGSLSKHGRGFVPIVGEELRTKNKEQRTREQEKREERREDGGRRTEDGEQRCEYEELSFLPLPQARVRGGGGEGIDQSCVFVELRLAGVTDSAIEAHVAALRGAGQPIVTIELADHYAVVGQIVWWQMAVATTAVVIGVNPFDEPDTVGRHAYLWRRLSQPDAGSWLTPAAIEPGALAFALQRIEPMIHSTGCIAIAAYVPPSPAVEAHMQALRSLLLQRYGVATVLVNPLRDQSYATQLLHAGRPCAMLLLAAETSGIVQVPGVDWTLNDLRRVRIAADVEAWTRMQRPFVHVDLGVDAEQGLRQLYAALGAAV